MGKKQGKRVTVYLPPDIWELGRIQAVKRHITFSALVERQLTLLKEE
jgi:hypothetical protein